MKTRQLAVGAVVGAAYFALTMAFAPISYGPVQFRISEALCVLPFICPSSAWGLFVGCVLANYFGGSSLLDVVFGSLATLAAGLITPRVKIKWLAPLPPVIINGLVVGAVLALTLNPGSGLSYFPGYALWVSFGEAAVCYGIGLPLLLILMKNKTFHRLMTMQK